MGILQDKNEQIKVLEGALAEAHRLLIDSVHQMDKNSSELRKLNEQVTLLRASNEHEYRKRKQADAEAAKYRELFRLETQFRTMCVHSTSNEECECSTVPHWLLIILLTIVIIYLVVS